jgi:uncharacterized membrane protein
MRIYRIAIRAIFALVFIAGGIVHFWMGRSAPGGYAAFGDTALFGWLGDLWASWVMPNIGWLTIALGIIEIACGIGLLIKRTARLAAAGMVAFLLFITTLGCAFQTTSIAEDFLKNRCVPLALALLLVPLLLKPGADRLRDHERTGPPAT